MAEQPNNRDPADPESIHYSMGFVFLLALLALATIGLQVGLIAMTTDNFVWLNDTKSSRTTSSSLKRPLITTAGKTVWPGNAVVWQGKIWVAMVTENLGSYRPQASRPRSSTLITIDPQTGQRGDSAIALSAAPIGLIVVDDQLWAVSENVVHQIQDGQAIQRNPRRGLNQPTNPFVYEGRLAVIDMNQDGNNTLLTWQDGEWVEMGFIDLPWRPAAWWTDAPLLRVIAYEGSYFLFQFEGQFLRYRQGFGLTRAEPPASALALENEKSLQPLGAIQPQSAIVQWPHWKSTPIAVNQASCWEVAIVDDELRVLISAPSTSTIVQFRLRDGDWIQVPAMSPVITSNFSLASGSPSFVVTNQFELYPIDDSQQTRRIQVQASPGQPEELRQAVGLFYACVQYLIVTLFLGLGTQLLMRYHRQTSYLYGKQTVTQASVLRRAIARGIDSLITIGPAFFCWMTIDFNFETLRPNQFSSHPEFRALYGLFETFGLWLGCVLILSIVEGRWGVTPGKWLCGIRALRTTLRPCGFVRAITRELLVYFDSLFFVNWLPGVMSIALTKNWQRLGDLAADTVVVRTAKPDEPIDD